MPLPTSAFAPAAATPLLPRTISLGRKDQGAWLRRRPGATFFEKLQVGCSFDPRDSCPLPSNNAEAASRMDLINVQHASVRMLHS